MLALHHKTTLTTGMCATLTKGQEASWESHRDFMVDATVEESESARPLHATMAAEEQPQESEISVTFLRAGITVPWTEHSGTLLELAEAHGIEMDYGCRYGDCATCLLPLATGRVAYLHPTGATPEPGTCLPCSCKPVTSVVLGP